eukprot:TRINITY_DN12988_c0_g1_i4.p1 TRINITY_DN12988_c0_g1~~TRINITY_DN12988_c0_g1_i4.p1  ORF type:complete len:154 (+),score=37.08 TRINITY_DN12988_c0_g1_i4:105-566(+)
MCIRDRYGGGHLTGTMVDRSILASEIFVEYDVDNSGILTADEFTKLLQAFDPRVKADGVVKTIEKISPGQPGLDLAGFNKWVTMVFGKASDEDFESGMRMLLTTAVATSPRRARKEAGGDVSENTWGQMREGAKPLLTESVVDTTWNMMLEKY